MTTQQIMYLSMVVNILGAGFWIAAHINRRANRSTEKAVDQIVVSFALPGAPPTGRSVLDAAGEVYTRELPPDREAEYYGYWGAWRHDISGSLGHWAELLTHGPLKLLPEDVTPRDVELYGPPGQRWGDPSIPCPWAWLNAKYAYEHGLPPGVKLGDRCALGIGHIGAHLDADGNRLGQTEEIDKPPITAAVTRQDLDTPCTCGHPDRHRPNCLRFNRLSGTDPEPMGG